MKKIILSAIVFVSVMLGLWYWENSKPVTTNPTPAPTASETQIKLFYYNPALDQGPGGAQCTSKGLVGVTRNIPKTTTPLTDSIKLLLKGELTEEEREFGITTEFPLAGVTLTSAAITDGVATLTFSDPQNKTGGGSCRVSVLWAQIEATAKQFPTVKSVRSLPEELFQP
jgi:spore germination protein GerM